MCVGVYVCGCARACVCLFACLSLYVRACNCVLCLFVHVRKRAPTNTRIRTQTRTHARTGTRANTNKHYIQTQTKSFTLHIVCLLVVGFVRLWIVSCILSHCVQTPNAVSDLGARAAHSSFLGTDGNLWLVGGVTLAPSANNYYLNDIWVYELSTGNWQWVAGYTFQLNNGGYCPENAVNAECVRDEIMGGAYASCVALDENGNLTIYGGSGFVYGSESGKLCAFIECASLRVMFRFYVNTSALSQCACTLAYMLCVIVVCSLRIFFVCCSFTVVYV